MVTFNMLLAVVIEVRCCNITPTMEGPYLQVALALAYGASLGCNSKLTWNDEEEASSEVSVVSKQDGTHSITDGDPGVLHWVTEIW